MPDNLLLGNFFESLLPIKPPVAVATMSNGPKIVSDNDFIPTDCS